MLGCNDVIDVFSKICELWESLLSVSNTMDGGLLCAIEAAGLSVYYNWGFYYITWEMQLYCLCFKFMFESWKSI